MNVQPFTTIHLFRHPGLARNVAALCAAILMAGCQMLPGSGGAGEKAAPPVAALGQFKEALEAQRAERWPDAEREYGQMLERYPYLSGPALNLALIYAQTGRPQLAEESFRRALTINADNTVAGDQYGVWLREQGRFGEAEAMYLQTLARDDACASAHLNLAILYDLYLENLPQALQHYQRYLELQGGEESPVQGWVIDLQRRIQKAG